MIRAEFEYIGPGHNRIILISAKANKSARVFLNSNGKWSIHYEGNGAFKHGFEKYPDVLTYLESKGW